jgi:hypothetical protein
MQPTVLYLHNMFQDYHRVLTNEYPPTQRGRVVQHLQFTVAGLGTFDPHDVTSLLG